MSSLSTALTVVLVVLGALFAVLVAVVVLVAVWVARRAARGGRAAGRSARAGGVTLRARVPGPAQDARAQRARVERERSATASAWAAARHGRSVERRAVRPLAGHADVLAAAGARLSAELAAVAAEPDPRQRAARLAAAGPLVDTYVRACGHFRAQLQYGGLQYGGPAYDDGGLARAVAALAAVAARPAVPGYPGYPGYPGLPVAAPAPPAAVPVRSTESGAGLSRRPPAAR